jgi:hypothetical protein
MQSRVDNGMNASRHQVHGKRVGGEKAGLVLRMGGEPSVSVARPLTRLSWRTNRHEVHQRELSHLASFAAGKRGELETLERAEVMAGLHEQLTRVTSLASVRSLAPWLMVAPLVLAQGPRSAPGPDADLGVDEGGIYSW